MTVPSHNLYDFVHQVTENRFWLIFFNPWGSRNLKHVVNYLTDPSQLYSTSGLDPEYCVAEKVFPREMENFFWRVEELQPILYCHDQEPLNFDLYVDSNLTDSTRPVYQGLVPSNYLPKNQNLRHARPMSNQKKFILLHSELNSTQVSRYEDTGQYQAAYWWSHAVLARDWYRFANTDKRLNPYTPKKTFLVYCRDTTGSRQYRQKFLDLAVDIRHSCQFQSFASGSVGADASAVYSPDDFNYTEISVVLETVFWDQRVHLTEKILRAIACAHPFILAAGPGSLKVLRDYGFETFSPWIDESYDNEPDHQTRLELIVKEMHRINALPPQEKIKMIEHCRAIAQRNKQRFFSEDFYNQVTKELKDNVETAYQQTKDQFDLTFYQNLLDHTNSKYKTWVRPFVEHITQGGSLEQYQRHEHGLDNKSSANGNDVQ
jgi:hypothetical protein